MNATTQRPRYEEPALDVDAFSPCVIARAEIPPPRWLVEPDAAVSCASSLEETARIASREEVLDALTQRPTRRPPRSYSDFARALAAEEAALEGSAFDPDEHAYQRALVDRARMDAEIRGAELWEALARENDRHFAELDVLVEREPR